MRLPACLFVLPTLLAPLVLAACHPPASPLSDVVVASGDGLVKAHVPKGDGWRCDKVDLDKDTFQQRGVKCTWPKGVVLYAKILDVDTNDARNAQLWCIQDWRQEYSDIFSGIQTYTNDVVDWHGTAACKVVIEGASKKGAWHLWEIHAPNGRRLLQITVSGFLPAVHEIEPTINAWVDDVKYDLKLPGQ